MDHIVSAAAIVVGSWFVTKIVFTAPFSGRMLNVIGFVPSTVALA